MGNRAQLPVGAEVRTVTWAGGSVALRESRIAVVDTTGARQPSKTPRVVQNPDGSVELQLGTHHVVPGFTDMHLHGSGGFDVMNAVEDPMLFFQLGRWLVMHGVTSYVATTVAAPLELLAGVLDAWVEYSKFDERTVFPAARCLGVHLEGPYINPDRAGAQNPGFIRHPSDGSWRELLGGSRARALRVVTLAPELPGAAELIGACAARGIPVAAGHTTADWAQIDQARRNGLCHVTHLFNGMPPMHHRRPGVTGAGLLMDDLYAELICDGIHVVPEMIRLYDRAKPVGRRILVTDAIPAAGQPPGDYELGGLHVTVGPKGAHLADGTLAGSTLLLAGAVRNYVRFTGCGLDDVLPAVTQNPAALLHEHSRGSIVAGKWADLVVLDHDLGISATVAGGRLAFARTGEWKRE